MEWQIRPLSVAADREMVERLWRAAMPPSWPVLPAGIGLLDAGLVAEAGAVTVGLVAIDPVGSIPLILVDPRCQRRGIGTRLLEAAVSQARAAGAAGVTAGSGGAAYIWPGVRLDLPAAVRFFAARGWQRSHADRKDVTGCSEPISARVAAPTVAPVASSSGACARSAQAAAAATPGSDPARPGQAGLTGEGRHPRPSPGRS